MKIDTGILSVASIWSTYASNALAELTRFLKVWVLTSIVDGEPDWVLHLPHYAATTKAASKEQNTVVK